ncbi:enoyl-CoA hydratase/isomerase family protein [Commensalibacter sp. ESL0382]|uniref:enoyl-CoA hydratase/isomerase family protein n=2 Tax=unclassified Commensalibacter TaxID=2630218 RepID=UPI0012D88BF8|nr:enoyl-CoA hydratase/isomerase family protein [Commensalibacter sp. ESL0382]
MSNLVIVQKRNYVGVLTLNRPQALNAIDDVLQNQILDVLEKWKFDSRIYIILINSSSERAFCAGGDIRKIADLVRSGKRQKGLEIFKYNYVLANYILHYSKPIISVMDGITMGGGIGLGAFATYRFVTERSILAMPEVMIGLTPDAGSSFLFQNAPGFSGLRAMLTGQRFNGNTAIKLGFADYMIYSSELELFLQKLTELQPNEINFFLSTYKQSYEFDNKTLKQIADIYQASSVAKIIEKLRKSKYNWAVCDFKTILKACPFSLEVTYRAWHLKLPTQEAVLTRDLLLISHLIQRADFLEGVRAAIIDKDHNPRWNQASISESEINSCFDY